jgi:fibronectin-binding autotransporter adhesin
MKPKSSNPLLKRFLNSRILLSLSTLLITASISSAADVYWDTNFTAAGSGNNGSSWEGVNWTSDAAGLSPTAIWQNGDAARFSAGDDGIGTWTVTLGSTISTPSITFLQPGSKTISGGTITIGGGKLDSSAIGFGNTAHDITINSVLAGSGGLTIAAHGDAISNTGGGGGAEFRLGGANTFTGGLTITSGLVSWNADNNLGDVSNEVHLHGGGLLYTGTADFTTTRSIKIGAPSGTFRLYGNSPLNIEGPISNDTGVTSATIRRTDGGTLRLRSQGSNFTGTWINGGGSTHLAAVNADWSNTDFTIDGGNLTVNGTGTAVVNSINSTADVIIDNGTTLNVDTGAITMRTAHWYKTNVQPVGKLTSSSGTLTVTNGAATGDLTTTDHQFQVRLVDSGATPLHLVKNNNNSLVLGQENIHTGGTTINGGRLQASTGKSYGVGTVTVNDGGQAYLTAAHTYANDFVINGNGVSEGANNYGAIRLVNTNTLTGNIHVPSAASIGTVGMNDRGILSGSLSGSGNLGKTGAGSLSITGDSSAYTGLLTASEGRLNLSNSFGGSVSIAAGATLSGEATLAGSLTLGSDNGATLLVDGSTPGALSTTDLTLNGVTVVRVTQVSDTPEDPIEVLRYSGTLTLEGELNDHIGLTGGENYRTPPTFTDTGSAITLALGEVADLVWTGADPESPQLWDVGSTFNWKNSSDAADQFFTADHVLFDDTAVTKTVALGGMRSPASITFNNDTDYSLTGVAGTGFTGATSIVKNGAGKVTIAGYSHDYTGTVTLNAGILQAASNETLGYASGVTIRDGGQLDINGKTLGLTGSNQRHYHFKIAGSGANGMGAITNTHGTATNENSGILHLTLTADASVGGTGGRFDMGRASGTTGTIQGNGFTLTKVGSNIVCVRAPAEDLTYVVAGGTLKFENYDSASGVNPIAVNAGILQSYGTRTFANVINFSAGTTLDNDGNGTQTWSGPINLTGTLTDTVNLRARNGGIIVSGAISGDSKINVNGDNILYLSGSQSNTYTGDTTVSTIGQLVLSKTGGAKAIPGDLILASTGVAGTSRATVSTVADHQFGPDSVLRFSGGGDARLELNGTTQTLAGLDSSGATTGGNCYIQHSENGTPAAVDGISDLVLNVPASDSYSFHGVLRDLGGKVNLVKSGLGTQTLTGTAIDFQGTTTVTEGQLVINSDDTWTSRVDIAAGAYYELNATSMTDTIENRFGGYTLVGTGTFVKSGSGAMSMGWSGGATVAMSPGALIEIAGGTMRLEYGVQTVWTNNKSDMTIHYGGALDLWDNTNEGVFVNALNGDGAVTRTKNATGSLTVGVDNGSGNFEGSISNSLGMTQLKKVGTGTQKLSGINTYTGDTTVSGGTLELASSGSLQFSVTDAVSNKITGTGNLVLDGELAIDTSAVTVANGTWVLIDKATLNVTYGSNFSLGEGWTKNGTEWSIDNEGQTWTFSETTGRLSLGSLDTETFGSWIGAAFPGETDPAIIGATADPDHDGIANLVEFVIGGDPASGNDSALLPTQELVENPEGLPAGKYFVFTYRRSDLALAANVTAVCETNPDLVGNWTEAVHGIDGVVIVEDDNYSAFTPPAEDTDRVRVYIPQGANAKLFSRLNVKTP